MGYRCQICGREIKNEEANFCEYCGAQAKGRDINTAAPEKPAGFGGGMANEAEEKPVGTLTWLGVLLLPFVPWFGFAGFIAVLCIWAFAAKKPSTKRNCARALLLYTVVLLLIVVAFWSQYGVEFLSAFTGTAL